MRIGSLFSGIGGFDKGFEDAGMECVWQADVEKSCRMVLNTHFQAEVYSDVREIGKHNLEPVDIICGGFPCQDVSIAGRRKGLAGERSGLWFEFRRIIDELKPEGVVIENVAGLLSSNGGRDLGTVVGNLAELGYWWAYRVLDAQYFGVPQRRRRIFIVASLRKGCPQEILFEPESSPWDTSPCRETSPCYTAAITERTRKAGRTLETQEDVAYALTNPGSGGRPHSRLIAFAPQAGGNTGLNINEDVSGTLQENQVMAVAAFGGSNTKGPIDVSTTLNAHGYGRLDFESETFICNTFNGYTGGADDNDAQGNHLVPCFTSWDSQPKRIHNTAVPSPTLASSDGGGGQRTPNFATDEGVRRLTPVECERLQGFPDNWTAGFSDSVRYRMLGNAVAVPVARWLGLRITKVCTRQNPRSTVFQ